MIPNFESRYRTVLKARNEDVENGERRLKERTEALERDIKIRQAEVRAEFSRYEQEAANREDLSTPFTLYYNLF